MGGALYLVSTPIGNLADITYRAVEILSSVTLIVAEDTRHSATLLRHYGVTTPVSSYHEHNEARETPRLVARLQGGDSIALISDAGTPLLSDPGERLVRAAVEAGVPIVPVPGPSALLAALVASGFPVDRFTFYGFLPRKGKERAETIAELVRSPVTAVLYESPNRIGATLGDLAEAGAADRPAVVGRELTKKFEELRRGTVAALTDAFQGEVRGEIVLVLAGAPQLRPDEATVRDRAAALLGAGLSPRDATDRLVQELKVPRNLAYRLVQEQAR